MSHHMQTLEQAINEYDLTNDGAYLKAAEEERQEVLKRFPLENWPKMSLEEYALGHDAFRDSFCYWMEWGTPHVGNIRGGAARKHLIYLSNSNVWVFDNKLYSTKDEAWEDIRAGFVEAFKKAKNDEWLAIDDIKAIRNASALRLKALYTYFPEKLMPISSSAHLHHFLQLLDCPQKGGQSYDVVRLNRALLAALRARRELQGFTTKQLGNLLYQWADPRESRSILKIVPGENAKYWQDCLPGGYICVGWDELEDLRQYSSQDQFRVRFDEIYRAEYKGHEPTLTKKANELWKLRELQAGDIIIANKGTSHVLAIGEVVDPGYQWAPERSECKHTVKVKWDTDYEQDVDPQGSWAFVTVKEVPVTLYHKILTKNNGTLPPIPVDPIFEEIADSLERKGQVILYGPPGTGKTYTARRFAVWWLLKQMRKDDPAQTVSNPSAFQRAEKELSTIQISRRAWWMVANPAEWSWESLFSNGSAEFKRGRLQRNYPLLQEGDLVVGYHSAPEKRVVALARVRQNLFGGTVQLGPVTRISDGLSYDELLADSVLSNSEPAQFRCQGTLFSLTPDQADHLISMLAERNPGIEKLVDSERGIAHLTRLTFHPSYSYEDFIEGFRPKPVSGDRLALHLESGIFKRVCLEALSDPHNPYLVFIDEINRGNIAKIFGELITLLEQDKRELQVTLPQSKDTLRIPKNVYIVGTMNTADRSIRLLDAALRRRFAFVERMPNLELLRGVQIEGLKLDEFLEKLNSRIAEKEGREKQIGHSFLMEGDQPIGDPHEYARRFRQEILPLLQEYCYENYGLLADYIGSTLVDREKHCLNTDVIYDDDKLLVALEEEFCSKTT